MQEPETDPLPFLEAAPWALAAMIGTLSDAATAPLADVLLANPARTAVLEAAGLVRPSEAGFTPHPVLEVTDAATARSAVAARLSALQQALDVASAEPGVDAEPSWAQHDDQVLLHQGRASAMTGQALATKVVPALPGLAERLAHPGSKILDVGTGVAALALALAEQFPAAAVTGVDVLPRAL
ncbi:MAG: SAM-dependent methyltransferase, partial [Catenulispora sp.]|nr:SAM-dependent methyltransferase [Catenulispora sp.]